MDRKTKNIVTSVNKNGIAIVENQFSKKVCKNFVNFFDDLLIKRIKKKEYVGTFDNQVLYNYFIENKKTLIFVYHNLINKVMKSLIDDDYVLTTPSARNRRIFDHKYFKKKKIKSSGLGWHTDAKYVNGKKIKPNFSYMAITVLEDTTKENGATCFVPNSHKLHYKPIRTKKYNFKYIEAPAGSIIFFDVATWHQAGMPTNKSRWTIFNLYNPWFVKPYWQFNKMLNGSNKKLHPDLKQLFHFNTTPHLNQNEGIATKTKIK